MDVAIMGAGLSGLACAITLERYGITPVIFEKRQCVGDRFVNAEAFFSILHRPVKDAFHELADKHLIYLRPIDTVTKLLIHSAHQVGTMEGAIGYTNIRGRQEDSLECQLARQVKGPIQFEKEMDIHQLQQEFNHVILATGDGAYASRLGNYQCDLTVSLTGATVTGRFLTSSPHVWFRYDIIPKGYAWLIPYSAKEANLVIAYPDEETISDQERQERWNRFYELAQQELKQDLPITDRFEVRRYMMGICDQPKLDRIYFTGNCFGALSPGLGFGQFSAMLTGVYAALDICGLHDYEELVQPLYENYYHSLALRRYLERLNDDRFDALVSSMNIGALKLLNRKLFSNSCGIDLLKWVTPFLS